MSTSPDYLAMAAEICVKPFLEQRIAITPLGAAMLALGDDALAVYSAARDRLAVFNEAVWCLRHTPADAAFVLGLSGPTELRDMMDGRAPIPAEVWARLVRAIDVNAADLAAVAADLRAAS